MIVGEAAVAADLGELGKQAIHVVEHRRPLRVARHEHALPRREPLVDLRPHRLDPLVQPVDGPLARGRLRHQRQRLDLLQEHGDRFFEFERIRRHGQGRSTQAHRTGSADLLHF
jgi:hypothetical protein